MIEDDDIVLEGKGFSEISTVLDEREKKLKSSYALSFEKNEFYKHEIEKTNSVNHANRANHAKAKNLSNIK